MAKIAILGDLHFGARNDNSVILDSLCDFLNLQFFPEVKRLGIDTIIQVGDVFDRRKYINFNTYHKFKQVFLDQIKKNNLKCIIGLGNHDTYWRNTSELNSVDVLLKEYSKECGVEYYANPIDFPELDLALVPWINDDNRDITMAFMNDLPSSRTVVGHFELNGFMLLGGLVQKDGLDPACLSRFAKVISGHYHIRQQQNNIWYVGTPIEISWSDFGNQKCYHFYDTDTKNLQAVPNPDHTFVEFRYNDTTNAEAVQNILSDTAELFAKFSKKYVRVIIEQRTQAILFDSLISGIESTSPEHLAIFDEGIEKRIAQDNMNSEVVRGDGSPITILQNYAQTAIADDSSRDKVMSILSTIYNEAVLLSESIDGEDN